MNKPSPAIPHPRLASQMAALLRRAATLPGVAPAVGIATAAALCLPVACYAMFSGFAPYDDEGYLLILLRQYSQGGVLYDQLFGHYGPAYFEVLTSVFGALGLDFTHAAGRSCTIALWISTSALCGAATYRLIANLPLALGAQLLAFMGLQLRNEPLHPGGLLCLILSLIIFVGSFLRPAHNSAAGALIGVLLAVATLIKINVGGFALVSTVFALLAGGRMRRGGSCVRWAAAAAMVLVPLVLTASRWDEPWVRAYASVVCCAALSVVLIQLDTPAYRQRPLCDLLAMVVGFTLTATMLCGWALARGTSATGLWQGILLHPLGQPRAFSVPLVLGLVVPWWAGLCVLFSLFFVVARRAGWLEHRAAALQGPAQLLAGAVIWLVAMGVLRASPFAASLPLLWIPLTTPVAAARSDARRTGTSLLGALAVLQALHAYPVAGSQTTWATFLFVPVGALGLAEGWRNTVAAARVSTRVGAPRVATLGAALAISLVLVTARALYEQGRTFQTAYHNGVPLNLVGAERVRVPAAQAAILQWLTRTLAFRCKSLLTMPGLNSLYLFTRTQPPTMLNTSPWMTMFTISQQAEMRDRFASAPSPLCVVRNSRLVNFWTQGRDFSDSPLAQYIDEQFVTVAALGGYEVMMQNTARAAGREAELP